MYEIDINEISEALFPCWTAADRNTVARVASGGEE